MYPARQVFFVLGLSRSGKAAAEFLLKRKAKTYIFDDVVGGIVEKNIRELTAMGAEFLTREQVEKSADFCDVLVLSPGIPIDHPTAVAFKRQGRAVIGETELAARYLSAYTVAVTGTNGKTTTVSMIEKVLKEGGLNAYACGNIGSPLIEATELSETSVAVAEISSFQLETLQSLRPHIAVVLNLSEDHLNRHYNMENYVFLKSRLLKNSTEAEYAVLNYDDPLVREMTEKTKARVLYFSTQGKVNGAYLLSGDLYFGAEKIMPAGELIVEGVHNIENALATLAVAKIMGVPTPAIAKALRDFKGIKHRIERVAEINGVTYIDDSKGTNADATKKAISCMKEETVLLLGGKDKGYEYDSLFAALPQSKVVHAILYGENRFRLLESAMSRGYKNFTVCSGFDLAVRLSGMIARSGQTVLLSPASASFDEFGSFEERGDRFVEIIRSFESERLTDGNEEYGLAVDQDENKDEE
ncbi:MAG: UDP-N-acetylmuramoyl-L-alanine--D-glutamate ligase [Clostridia bacterium]|nr:UDP-N-acetylmuramoyl-L-alanine--D-glutamate ligase [Clostridia bacterium]